MSAENFSQGLLQQMRSRMVSCGLIALNVVNMGKNSISAVNFSLNNSAAVIEYSVFLFNLFYSYLSQTG